MGFFGGEKEGSKKKNHYAICEDAAGGKRNSWGQAPPGGEIATAFSGFRTSPSPQGTI